MPASPASIRSNACRTWASAPPSSKPIPNSAALGTTTEYPGARFDSESFTYGYSFSRELLDEWHWTEQFSPQPETLRYLDHVADRFGLREHMQFGCRVDAMVFDEETDTWTLKLQDGRQITTRFVATAVGVLSTPTLPRIEARESFQGRSFHSFLWPHEPFDLTGKRVAVIGTGATAIQLIPEVGQGGGATDGVPAAPELGGAPEQRAHLRIRDGRDSHALRRDLRHLRPHTGRFRT